jgi:transcriptional antiterminator RfaH
VTTKDYSKPQWFLIYTKSRQEERAKENLENQGFETFLPMIAYEKIKQPKLYSLKPMFPRYLFTKFNVEKNNWTQIKSTRGVSYVVVFGDNFTEVPNSMMDYLKSKVDDNDVLKLQTTRKTFQKGDEVIIKQGAFQGKEAKFLSMSGKERVRVLLSFMNQVLITDLPGQNIERQAISETFKL